MQSLDWFLFLKMVSVMVQQVEVGLSFIYVLLFCTALDSKMSSRSAIEWVLQRGSMIENLKEAIMGNYQSIVSLTAVLNSGTFSKKILDHVIDRCK